MLARPPRPWAAGSGRAAARSGRAGPEISTPGRGPRKIPADGTDSKFVKFHCSTKLTQNPFLCSTGAPEIITVDFWAFRWLFSVRTAPPTAAPWHGGRRGHATQKKRRKIDHSAKHVPKKSYVSSRGTKVVLKWPSGGPGTGLCLAPGPPEGHYPTNSGALSWVIFLRYEPCYPRKTDATSTPGPIGGRLWLIVLRFWADFGATLADVGPCYQRKADAKATALGPRRTRGRTGVGA